jgi:hypothetical protein
MKEIKRTYKFERTYTHGLNGHDATVFCEVEVDREKKVFFVNNLTTHHLNGAGYEYNIPKIKATIEMHLDVAEFLEREFAS